MSSYKWRRASQRPSEIEARLNGSRTDENDPRLWCEKVAAATDHAVATVSGKKKPGYSKSGSNAMSFALVGQNDVYIDDDEIQKTAQDLLNQWMNENVEREKEEKQLQEQLSVVELESSDRSEKPLGTGSWSSFDNSVLSNGAPDGYKRGKSAMFAGNDRRSTLAVDKRNHSTNFDLLNVNENKRGSLSPDLMSGPLSSFSSKSRTVDFERSQNESELTRKMAELEEKYELMTVDSILDGILNKQFDQNKHVMNNLGFKSGKQNKGSMVAKMELRHQQVMKKREERVKKSELSKKEFETNRETEMAARKLLLDEEKLQIEQKAMEERKIQEEMDKIRKEIQEQRNVMREQQKRDFALRQAELEKEKLRVESEKQKKELERIVLEKSREESKRKIAARLEQVKLKGMKINMVLLQKHFHAWYNFIVDQRLKIGKAVALSEWRLMSKIYNNWKHKTIQKQCEKEALRHEESMKKSVHLEKLATDHNKGRLLKKCFNRWLIFVTISQEESDLQKEAKTRKERLEKFLDAAKTGKLWSDIEVETTETENEDLLTIDSTSDATLESAGKSALEKSQRFISNRSTTSSFRSEKVFKMFHAPAKGLVTSTPRSNSSGSHFENGSRLASSVKVATPTMPWQVRRNMVSDLTVEQLEQIGQSTKKAISASAKKVQEKLSEKQIAQQKQLEQQEKILKNQQKVIDQLQRQLVTSKKNENQEGFPSELNGTPNGIETHGLAHQDLVNFKVSGRSEISDAASQSSQAIGKKHHDPIVSAMEERERIRQEKRAKFEAIKRQKADEKFRQAKIEQEELEQKLQEEKKAAAEKRRQEIQLQKETEKRKAESLARVQALNEKADKLNVRRIMKFYGLIPWMQLIKIKHQFENKAFNFYAQKVCGKCFNHWRVDARQSAELKQSMALELSNYFLVRRHFRSWCRYKEILDILFVKAERHHTKVIKRNFFKYWIEFTDNRRTENLVNCEIAEKHNEERLIKRCFESWKALPRVEKAERERVSRRAELRSLVAQIIPDFKGTSASVEQTDDLNTSEIKSDGDNLPELDENGHSSVLTGFDLRKRELYQP
ncbi:uncharacterized protein LOC142341812 [Convolutriloba macropyga]|uniref:uncharacterized protein LOC142341812 n=1 Tax=Convolutriloba macropyga TaxID=536237 RepID=UPI003F5265AA